MQYIVDFVNSVQGLRKTAVMVGLMAMGCILRVKGYISGDNLADLLKSTVVAFFAANGMEYLTTTVKTYVNSKGEEKKETIIEEENAK